MRVYFTTKNAVSVLSSRARIGIQHMTGRSRVNVKRKKHPEIYFASLGMWPEAANTKATIRTHTQISKARYL